MIVSIKLRERIIEILAIMLTISVILFSYKYMLYPLVDNKFEFVYGDLTTLFGLNSGRTRKNITFYSWNNKKGTSSVDTSRAFLLEGISILSDYFLITDSQIQSIIILISIILGVLGIYLLTKIFLRDFLQRIILFYAITVFYFLNLWSTERIGHLWIWTCYAVLPLFLALGILFIVNKDRMWTSLIAYSLIFSFYGVLPHSFIYMFIIHIFICLHHLFRERKITVFLAILIIPTVIHILLNSPIIFLMLVENSSYPVVISYDILKLLSRNGEILNFFTFSNNWWPYVPVDMVFKNYVFRTSSLLIFVYMVILTITFWKKLPIDHKFLVALSLAFIGLIAFIAQGTNNNLLNFILDFLSTYRMLEVVAPLREWARISILAPIFMSLTFITIGATLKQKSNVIISIITIVLIHINVLFSPSLPYLNEVFNPTYIPSEYYELADKISDLHKILWIYPSEAKFINSRWMYRWDSTKAISNIIEYSIGSTYPDNNELIQLMKRINAPINLLKMMNIRYVTFRTDIEGARRFKVDYSQLLCGEHGFLTIRRGDYASNPLYVSSLPIFMPDFDAKKLYSVAFINSVPVISPGKGFFDTKCNVCKHIILSERFLDNLNGEFTKSPAAIIITPYSYVYRYNPEISWSRGSTSDPLHGEWHPYLELIDLENWQTDYGFGLVFTDSVSNLQEHIDLDKSDLIRIWSFESLNEYIEWKNYTSENQFGALHVVELENGALKIELWNSSWGWKVIGSPLIEVEYGNWYRWRLRLKAHNGYEVHVKVAEFNQLGDIISVKYTYYVGNGTYDWKTIEINYSPKNPETRLIQLQVWHGHETPLSIPNTIWVDDVEVYDLRRYTQPMKFEVKFTINEPNDYILLARVFYNREGGRIKIELNGKDRELITRDNVNKFRWREVDTIFLDKGEHKIVITNVEGFNAINLLALIPKSVYQEILSNAKLQLLDKINIYILEAESDMYLYNVEVVENINASNGKEVIIGTNGLIEQYVEIPTDGYYVVALRFKGILEVVIDNAKYILSSYSGDFVYSGPIYLSEGLHRIEIRHSGEDDLQYSTLDVLWIYSVEEDSGERLSLYDLLYSVNRNAEVVEYVRIDPTQWASKIYAKKPFFLVFAETYSLNWKAYIYRNDSLIDVVSSIPVYRTINGFWIDAVGNLTIVIRYTPQNLFEIGMKMTTTSLTVCLLCLTLPWIRKTVKYLRKVKHRKLATRV